MPTNAMDKNDMKYTNCLKWKMGTETEKNIVFFKQFKQLDGLS